MKWGNKKKLFEVFKKSNIYFNGSHYKKHINFISSDEMIWSGLLWQSWWKLCFSAMINKVVINTKKASWRKHVSVRNLENSDYLYLFVFRSSIVIFKDLIIISEWNGFGTILKIWRSISFLFLYSWNPSPNQNILEAFIVATINDKVHQTVDDNQKVIDWCWTDEPSGWNEIAFTNHQFVDVKKLV